MYKLKLLYSLALTVIFMSCSVKKDAGQSAQPAGIPVQVTDARGLDGCQFLLVTGSGEKLQPVNLADQYKKSGMRIYVTYKNYNGMSTCMSGTMVELLSVTPAP
jgi:hypothetical protein